MPLPKYYQRELWETHDWPLTRKDFWKQDTLKKVHKIGGYPEDHPGPDPNAHLWVEFEEIQMTTQEVWKAILDILKNLESQYPKEISAAEGFTIGIKWTFYQALEPASILGLYEQPCYKRAVRIHVRARELLREALLEQ